MFKNKYRRYLILGIVWDGRGVVTSWLGSRVGPGTLVGAVTTWRRVGEHGGPLICHVGPEPGSIDRGAVWPGGGGHKPEEEKILKRQNEKTDPGKLD